MMLTVDLCVCVCVCVCVCSQAFPHRRLQVRPADLRASDVMRPAACVHVQGRRVNHTLYEPKCYRIPAPWVSGGPNQNQNISRIL